MEAEHLPDVAGQPTWAASSRHLRDLDHPAHELPGNPDRADRTLRVAESLGQGQPLYVVLYALGTSLLLFYTSIFFNPTDTADNMRKYGRFHTGHPAR